jgi:hypothetical protein
MGWFCTWDSFLCSVGLMEWNEVVLQKRIFPLNAECAGSTESVERPRFASLASPLISISPKKKKSDQTDTPRPTPRTLSPRYDFGLVSLHPSFLAAAALEYPSVAALCRSKHAAAAEEGERRRQAVGGRRAAGWRRWYVSNVSIIFNAPCLFLHHLPTVSLHFVALLCIFWN